MNMNLNFNNVSLNTAKKANRGNTVINGITGVADIDVNNSFTIIYDVFNYSDFFLFLKGMQLNTAFYTETGAHNHNSGATSHSHGATATSLSSHTHTHSLTTDEQSRNHNHSGVLDARDVEHSHADNNPAHTHNGSTSTQTSGSMTHRHGSFPWYFSDSAALHTHTINSDGAHVHTVNLNNAGQYTFEDDKCDDLNDISWCDGTYIPNWDESEGSHTHPIDTYPSTPHQHALFNSPSLFHYHSMNTTPAETGSTYLENSITHNHIPSLGNESQTHTHNGTANNVVGSHTHTVTLPASASESSASFGNPSQEAYNYDKNYFNALSVSIWNYTGSVWEDITSTILSLSGLLALGDTTSGHDFNLKGVLVPLNTIITRSNYLSYIGIGKQVRFKFIQSGNYGGRLQYKFFS